MSHTILVPGPTEGLQDVALLVEGGAAALRLADVGVFRPVPIRHGNASVLGRILAPQSILVLEEVLSVPLKKCLSCSLPLHLHLTFLPCPYRQKSTRSVGVLRRASQRIENNVSSSNEVPCPLIWAVPEQPF